MKTDFNQTIVWSPPGAHHTSMMDSVKMSAVAVIHKDGPLSVEIHVERTEINAAGEQTLMVDATHKVVLRPSEGAGSLSVRTAMTALRDNAPALALMARHADWQAFDTHVMRMRTGTNVVDRK
jgi:hypothetical protein